jgi:predicted MPP superfamily phosphohydrolase
MLAVVGICCLAYAYFIEPYRLVINRTSITIKNLDPAFDGLTIALLGDVHGGSRGVTEEKLREIVARTNEQNVDLVVLLGDYVSQKFERTPLQDRALRMPIETIADNLRGIKATYGVIMVLGNHDGDYSNERVAAEFTRVGYKVLQNEVASIERNGSRMRILGMTDHLSLKTNWEQTSQAARALVAAAGTGDLIVLQHSPDILQVISGGYSISPDLRLMLAAHTHGGQVWLPILGTPIIPSGYGQRYAHGHVRDNSIDMFVTSGIGTSLLPLRFMVPPEIAVVTIRSE